MAADRLSMTVGSLRFLVSQIPDSDNDKEIGVFMPHYGRTFPIVALDHLSPDGEHDESLDAPLVLIADRKPRP